MEEDNDEYLKEAAGAWPCLIESSGSGGRGLAQTQNTTLFKPHWKRPKKSGPPSLTNF